MDKEIYKWNGKEFERVSKRKAEFHYNLGGEVILSGNNENMYSYFYSPCVVQKKSLEDKLETKVNEFLYYLEPTLGKRVKYFIQV